MHLPLGLPSHLSSLLPFLNDIKKKKDKNATDTSHKKFSEGKQAHVGMEALKTNRTRWEWMTPQHFHTIPTSCAILRQLYAHHKTLYIHLAYSYALNKQGTQLCSLQSYT